MFSQHRDQVRTIHQRNRLVPSEGVGIRAITAGGDENTAISSFIKQGAVEIPNSSDINRTRIALCLNHEFSAAEWIRIKYDRVHAAITRRTCNLYLSTVFSKFPLIELAYQMLEIIPWHGGKICVRFELFRHLATFNDPIVVAIENKNWTHRRNVFNRRC